MVKREFSLEILQDYAVKKGGELISTEYINTTTFYIWRCKYGHQWKATALDVLGKKNQKGSWCPKCAPSSTLLNLEDIE